MPSLAAVFFPRRRCNLGHDSCLLWSLKSGLPYEHPCADFSGNMFLCVMGELLKVELLDHMVSISLIL